ncbi:CHAT domain-containing protein [Sulfidibacter corallicola]|uniref:CHAT domain-containing protein n=1 Tax=Sulfidibacter corallicola TaxID=2818388 RepID=A0A8A4TRZ3_SULCO|nr:CHAT domain-containing protein [Sulfidibacter corallicola]QTD51798.1 CHAT domain-containing protein [Sulfidibacter corallicola]
MNSPVSGAGKEPKPDETWVTDRLALAATLEKDETRAFRMEVEPGDVIAVRVLQRNLDVALHLFGPADRERWVEDGPTGGHGLEILWFPVREGGTHRLELVRIGSAGADPRFELDIRKLADPTEAEWSRAQAQSLTREALLAGRREGRAALPTERFLEALDLWERGRYPAGKARTLDRLGDRWFRLQRLDKAVAVWKTSVEILRAEGDCALALTIQTKLARAFEEMGDLASSRGQLVDAVQFADTCPSPHWKAGTVRNLGAYHHRRNQIGIAIDQFRRSCAMFRNLGDPVEEARCLEHIAAAFLLAGKPEDGLRELAEARALWRGLDDSQPAAREQAGNLIQIGRANHQLDRLDRALAAFEEALVLVRGAQDFPTMITVLDGKGKIHRARKEFADARECYEHAIDLVERHGLPSWQAHLSLNLARTLYEEVAEGPPAPGERELLATALTLVDSALVSHRRHDSVEGLVWDYYLRGRILDRQGRHPEALEALEQAIRELAHAMPSRGILAKSFRHTRDLVFREYQQLAMAQARRTSDPSLVDRVFAVHEYQTAFGLEASLALHDIEGASAHRSAYRALQARINENEYQRVQLLLQGRNPESVAELERLVQADLLQLHQLRPTPVKLPDDAPFRRVPVPEIQRELLATNDIAMVFMLNEPRSVLWCIDREGVRMFEDLPGRARLTQLARQYAHVVGAGPMESRKRRQVQKAIQLRDALFGEAVQVMKGKHRLLLVLDDALHQVSFATLASPIDDVPVGNLGYRPLIADFEITRLPSLGAALTMVRQNRRRSPAPRIVALFGDPVYNPDDPRLVRKPVSVGPPPILNEDPTGCGIREYARLSRAAQNAEIITGLVADPDLKHRELGLDATPLRFWLSEPHRYRILHFSAHGLLHPGEEELSAIVLSLWNAEGMPSDGYLRAHDLYESYLPAELAVIGGCRTADGQWVSGEGVVGLSQHFMSAGCSRVIAGMWPMSENAAADIVSSFYRILFDRRISSTGALRAAQLDAIERAELADPFHWGVFIHHGLGAPFSLDP